MSLQANGKRYPTPEIPAYLANQAGDHYHDCLAAAKKSERERSLMATATATVDHMLRGSRLHLESGSDETSIAYSLLAIAHMLAEASEPLPVVNNFD